MNDKPGSKTDSANRRLRGFAFHLGLYFFVILVMVSVNYNMSPETLWFVWPMVGWGGFFALHAAYAMGLFDGLSGGPK